MTNTETLDEMMDLDEAWAEQVSRGCPYELVTWAVDRGFVTRSDLEEILEGQYAHALQLLGLLHEEGVMTRDAYGLATLWWVGYRTPEDDLRLGQWTEMFRAGGYTVDGERAERPSEPLRLYRGAPIEACDGMSWTPDPMHAALYALGGISGEVGHLWTAPSWSRGDSWLASRTVPGWSTSWTRRASRSCRTTAPVPSRAGAEWLSGARDGRLPGVEG